MNSDGDGTKQIKGVDTHPKGREPRQRDNNLLMPGMHSEMIQESHYADGQVRHGTNPDNIHRTARTDHYASETQQAHRRSLGGTAHPDSKGR
jgi:hypothetical protein